MANFFDKFDRTPTGNYFDQFDPIAPQSSLSQELTGIPKQIGAGLIESAAGIPSSVPQALGQIGSAVSDITGLPKSEPIPYSLTPGGQLSSALPAPQTGVEQAARTLGQFPLSAISARGHLGENITGGIGAGLGAYFGPQIAPYVGATPTEGAIGGALVGGFAGARGAGYTSNAAARHSMPTPQEVLDATSDTYTALRQANRGIVLPPDAMSIIKDGTLNLLKSQGPDEADAKEVYSIIKNLDTDTGGTVADLINARKNLHGHFQGGPDANKPAAAIALQVVDAMLGKVASPGTLAELQRSDANWSAARTAQAVTSKIDMAESGAEGANSGLNSGNKILQSINSYIKSRTDEIGKVHLAPSDLEALNSVRNLSPGQQLGRYVSGILGGGGGIGSLLAGGAGALGASGLNELGYNATEKDPLYGSIALPALGLLTRLGFNRSVGREAKNAEAAILARAPYVQSSGAAVPHNLLSSPQIAMRSLLFASPAMRNELFPQGAQ